MSWNCSDGAPPQTTTDVIAGTVEVILGVVVISSSILVLLSIKLFQKLQIPSNYGIFNLALADLWVGISLPFLAAFYFDKSLQLLKYPCLLRFVVIVASCLESAFTLCLIAIDRFIHVEYPLRYDNYMGGKKLIIAICSTWIYIITYSFLPIFGWHTWTKDDCRCAMIDIFSGPYILSVAIHLIILITIMCIMYGRIFWTARKHRAKIGAMDAGIPKQTDAKPTGVPIISKATKMMFLLLGVFIITWLPFIIIVLIQASLKIDGNPNYNNEILSYAQIFSGVLGITNSVWNPIIYAWKNRDFRLAFKKILSCKLEDRTLVHEDSSY